MLKKSFVATAIALLGTQALAADSGWYVGGDISSTKFKAEGESARETGFGAFVGYSLSPNLAIEAQLRRLGSDKEDGVEVSANSLSLSLVGKMPVAEQFVLFGRFGMARNSLDVSEGPASVSIHKNKALVGIGADYLLNKQVSLRAEFVNLGSNQIGSGADAVSIKIQQFNFGVSYSF